MSMTQVFISYSRKDLSFVEQLVSDLKNEGFDVWYDVSGIAGGTQWRSEIENALKNSQYIIVVLSPDSIASEWVEREFLFANNLKRKIIPLMYRFCELPLNYVNLNYIDVQEGKYKQEFPKILHALNFSISNSTSTSPKTERRSFTLILIGFVGVAIAIVVMVNFLPALINLISLTPTSISSPVITPTLQPLATKSPTPAATYTPEPSYTIVDAEEVLNIAPNTQTLGQLAKEKYSLEERNNPNGKLTFTIEAASDVSMLWRWFWCATSQSILDENMKAFDVEFVIDGGKIPNDQFAQLTFTNTDPSLNGWKCFTYETVLRDWKPGVYNLVQTVKLKSNINDGQDTYTAGTKVYDYTVSILP